MNSNEDVTLPYRLIDHVSGRPGFSDFINARPGNTLLKGLGTRIFYSPSQNFTHTHIWHVPEIKRLSRIGRLERTWMCYPSPFNLFPRPGQSATLVDTINVVNFKIVNIWSVIRVDHTVKGSDLKDLNVSILCQGLGWSRVTPSLWSTGVSQVIYHM